MVKVCVEVQALVPGVIVSVQLNTSCTVYGHACLAPARYRTEGGKSTPAKCCLLNISIDHLKQTRGQFHCQKKYLSWSERDSPAGLGKQTTLFCMCNMLYAKFLILVLGFYFWEKDVEIVQKNGTSKILLGITCLSFAVINSALFTVLQKYSWQLTANYQDVQF